MAPPSPFKDRPEYGIATKLAGDLADLLAPQSGAYYDIWLDGEKFVTSTFEVQPWPLLKLTEGIKEISGFAYSDGCLQFKGFLHPPCT